MHTSVSTASVTKTYKSTLPPHVIPYLKELLDWDHEGVEQDLREIAYHMIDWEGNLATLLELTDVDIHDIKYINNPELQRYNIRKCRVWYLSIT